MTDALTFVLELSIRTAAVALCVGGILAIARLRSGAVRHAAWTAVLGAMLLMPVLSNLAPTVGMPAVLPRIAVEIPHIAQAPTPMKVQPETIRVATPSRVPAPSSVDTISGWPIVLAVYCLGLLLFFARAAVGWRAACRFANASDAVDLPAAGIPVYQSGATAAPLTIGVLRSRIVLPLAWTTWPDRKLRAVLAHETAHVRRRDPLIALLAHVNRCIFWFHPLAWWLERKLAITAEQACDEAGVRALGESRAYSEILLEIAETVRRNGARHAWMGVGMAGSSRLEQRIDHLLLTGAGQHISRKRIATVAIACAVVIFLAAGCRSSNGQSEAIRKLESELRQAQDRVNFLEANNAVDAMEPGPRFIAPFAVQARKKLEQSKDMGLILVAATRLVGMQPPEAVGADLFLFGKRLIDRALELQPDSTWARHVRNMAVDKELTASLPKEVWQGPFDSRRSAIARLPEGDRFRELAILALAAGDEGVRAGQGVPSSVNVKFLEKTVRFPIMKPDLEAEKAAWQQAGNYAREALEIAPNARSHPDYGTAFFNANMVLGMAAVKSGDAKTGAAYLLKAAEAPPTDALKYPIPNARPWRNNWQFPATLTTALTKAGEADAVAKFRESYARLTVTGRIPAP